MGSYRPQTGHEIASTTPAWNMLIHIGYRKTGTSWLQQRVFNNACKGFVCHWHIYTGEPVEYFVLRHPAKFDPQEVRDAFHKAYADTQSLVPVISHEDLSGYPENGRYYEFDVCTRLRQTFPDARILIGIREQKSMILSTYRQYVRSEEGCFPLEAFIGNGKERPGFVPLCRLDHFEFDLLVKKYFDTFGKEKVLVLPIECLRTQPLSFEQRIHDFCGTGHKAEQLIPPVNIGWRAGTLAIRRRLNRFVRRPPLWQGDWKRLPLLWRGVWRLCNVLDRTLPRRWQQAAENRLKRIIAERTGDYYKESNRRLSQLIDADLGALGYDV
jgi:hypothetical protein